VPGEYHNGIQACSTMIEDGEKYILDAVPEVLPTQNTDSLTCIYSIEENSLVGDVDMTLSGECKQAILSLIYMLDSSRRNSVLKQFLEKGKAQEKVSNILIEGEGSEQNQLKITYREMRNGSVNKIGNEWYIDLESRQDYATVTIDTTERKVDFIFQCKEKTVREEYLLIPEGFEVVSVPDELLIENDNYKIDIVYGIKADKIKYRKEIVIKNTCLKKENFAQWNADLTRLKRNYSEQIVLHKIKND